MSPSKTLVKFANLIASHSMGPVLDVPSGYGRNALALAGQGCTVIAIDKDRKRLFALDQMSAAYFAEYTSVNTSFGRVYTVCADLSADGWPVAPSSVSAIICVHFRMVDLIPGFVSSLQKGGYLYVETFGGQGENFRELPKAKQLRELLARHMELTYYKERKVGPKEFDSVAVTLFAQRR